MFSLDWCPFRTTTILLLALSSVASAKSWGTPFKYQTQGCQSSGFDLDESGHVNRTINGRRYLLHIPPEYNASQTHPLVLSFHGTGHQCELQEYVSHLSDGDIRIAGSPVIAAYPQAEKGTRGDHHPEAWYSAPYHKASVDDFSYIKGIIKDIADNYCVNPLRLYATGKSNGGGLTAALACKSDFSQLFAAFAPVSAAVWPNSHAFDTCEPARPVPILTAHGKRDPVIPFDGHSTDFPYPSVSVPQFRQEWAIRNGCEAQDETTCNPTSITKPHDHTTMETWDCNAKIVGLTVGNLGHAWPSTTHWESWSHKASFDFTRDHLVQFFSDNPLPVAYLNLSFYDPIMPRADLSIT